MSIAMQNYLVYLIVGLTFLKLTYPVFKKLYQIITVRKMAKQDVVEYSCYTACSKCGLKN